MNASGDGDNQLFKSLSVVIVFIDQATLSMLFNPVFIVDTGDVFIVETDGLFILDTGN